VPERRIGLAAFYNAVMAGRGFSLAPHHYPIVAGLEDERIENLLYLAPPGTGKSNLLCIVYPLYQLGHDPAKTVLSVSAGAGLPTTFMTASMQVIQHSKVWKELFPEVCPAPDMGWSIQRGLFVRGHHPEDENASYMSCGIASKALTGLHCREMILDDIHDKENAATPESRAGIKDVYYNTLMGRADPRGCRRVAAGRWWAPDDIYQEWIEGGDWVVLELPAARAGNKKLWYDVYVPKGLACVYSERLEKMPAQDSRAGYDKYRYYYAAVDQESQGFYWPGSKSKRKEYFTIERRQPRIAAVNYRGDMSGGGNSVFDKTDFPHYLPPQGLSFGIAHTEVRRWADSMKGDIEDAWDTAHGQVQSESKTANLTGLMVPCQQWHRGEDTSLLGACDFHFDVYLLDIYVGDPNFGELVSKFRERHGLWHPRRMNVEEKQSGISLLSVMKNAGLPVHAIKVVEGKLERAVNSVLMDELPVGGGAASVQGWAKMGRIWVPDGAAWVDDFLEKVCEFKGGSRASDEFDALVHLVTRAILRSRKRGMIGRMNAATGAAEATDDPRRQALDGFGQLARQVSAPVENGIYDPYSNFCGAPCHWFGIVANAEHCKLHSRRTTTFDGCSNWVTKNAPQAVAFEAQRAWEGDHAHG
jgi:hypothetical protein